MMVKHTLDRSNPPKMSKAERARFDAIRDEDIDCSDISELDAAFWAKAKIEKARQKPSVTMRMDEQTLAYFKGNDPKGYTGRMAAVLKAYVQAQATQTGLAISGPTAPKCKNGLARQRAFKGNY